MERLGIRGFWSLGDAGASENEKFGGSGLPELRE